MASNQIQWYPGHMHKATREITAMLKKVDVCIEVLDARIPYSSENPMLLLLRGAKPCLKVLAKNDLADPHFNSLWQQYFESDALVSVLLADVRNSRTISRIPDMCRQLYSRNGGTRSTLTAMVMGIPNAGKSTLINGLRGKTVAKTGNQPAVTKVQQVIEIESGFVLLDTPGVMWPKVENKNSGYRLAVTGAIRDTAFSHEAVAEFAASYFMEFYSQRLIERYNLENMPNQSHELLTQVGRARGCLVKGGQVDMDRAAKILLADIRDGRLGRYTLETPEMMVRELVQIVSDREEKIKRDLERKSRWKKSGA